MRPRSIAPLMLAALAGLGGGCGDGPAGDATGEVTGDAAAGWSVVNDTVMGGVSTGRLAWDDGALVFTGELSLDNNGGFASVRSPLVDPAAAAGWAERTGLAVEAQGDGRAWTVEVRTDTEDGGWIAAISTSPDGITAVELPWATFEPVTRFLDLRVPAGPSIPPGS